VERYWEGLSTPMLREIYIRNLVLIEELRLEFGPGLNVFTGETGAGKSIVIDALGLITGERMSTDLVRDPSQKAVVEAVFSLENSSLKEYLGQEGFIEEEDDYLVLRREIGEAGRGTVRINGRTVTVSRLKSLGEFLVDIHLQQANQLLLEPRMYRHYLDRFGSSINPLLQEVRRLYDRWHEKRKELDELVEGKKERLRELDFLQFQIKEIESAQLARGEDAELEERYRRLRDAERLRRGTEDIYSFIYGGAGYQSAYDLVALAIEKAQEVRDDACLAEVYSLLETCLYNLEDIKDKLAAFQKNLEADPQELERIEERLETINRLKKKYGSSIEEIFGFLEEARRKSEHLQGSEARIEELENDVRDLEKAYLHQARLLSEQRQKAAQKLQVRVCEELLELGMPGVRLEVKVTPVETWGREGIDQVTLMFSANPGEEPKPLGRVVSGGELSRLILALKKVLAEAYDVPTLVFDEIDVGVGGSALNAMAKKLFELSLYHQVLLVTHSPQIAGLADEHFLLEKSVERGVTVTQARKLDQEERVSEIARMLSGDPPSLVSFQHAREILTSGIELKRKIRKAGIEQSPKG